jgi:hypothetical protein
MWTLNAITCIYVSKAEGDLIYTEDKGPKRPWGRDWSKKTRSQRMEANTRIKKEQERDSKMAARGRKQKTCLL